MIDVAIAGGGIAGSALAAILARAGRKVAVFEKDQFPRDKLCGEFLSTEVRRELAGLGVEQAVLAKKPAEIEKARFVAASGRAVEIDLGGTALGLSRRTLDALLFEHARASGASCETGVEVEHATRSSLNGIEAKLVVCAHGRRGRLDKKLDRAFTRERHPYAAIKRHYRATSDALRGLVELHAFDGGYCGFCFIEDGIVNACALVETARADVRSIETASPSLAARFSELEAIEGTEQAVAEIPFSMKETSKEGVLFLGDAAGMIAPLAGDGQAMALASARILAALILAHPPEAPGAIAAIARAWDRAWRAEFARRMLIGRALQAILLRRVPAGAAIRVLDFVPALSSRLVKMTRG